MKELLFFLPISAAIALVLGACRGETLSPILRESGKSFLRIVIGTALICVVLQLILLLVPPLSS